MQYIFTEFINVQNLLYALSLYLCECAPVVSDSVADVPQTLLLFSSKNHTNNRSQPTFWFM